MVSFTEECIDFLEVAEAFSALEASSHYWHVKVKEGNCNMTLSTSNHEIKRFIWM